MAGFKAATCTVALLCLVSCISAMRIDVDMGKEEFDLTFRRRLTGKSQWSHSVEESRKHGDGERDVEMPSEQFRRRLQAAADVPASAVSLATVQGSWEGVINAPAVVIIESKTNTTVAALCIDAALFIVYPQLRKEINGTTIPVKETFTIGADKTIADDRVNFPIFVVNSTAPGAGNMSYYVQPTFFLDTWNQNFDYLANNTVLSYSNNILQYSLSSANLPQWCWFLGMQVNKTPVNGTGVSATRIENIAFDPKAITTTVTCTGLTTKSASMCTSFNDTAAIVPKSLVVRSDYNCVSGPCANSVSLL